MPIKPSAPSSHDLRTSALLPFLAITFLITWGLIGVYILAPAKAAATFGEISGTHPFFFLATWAPAIAAFLVVAYHGGASGIRAFLTRLLLWRCPPGWIAFILILPPLVFAAGSLIKGGPLLAPLPPEGAGPVVAVMFMMLLLGPVEEFGWRGVMQPLLQRHMAPIWAGLIIGATWGFWHLPAFFLSSTVYADWNFLPFFIGNVTLAVLFTPILNSTRGSLLWPMLFHWQLINPFWPDAQPWDTIILIGVAVVVVWWNRATMFTREGAVTEVVPVSTASARRRRSSVMLRTLILAGTVALAGFAAPVLAQDGPSFAGRLEAVLEEFHDRYAFPGATAAIALPNGTVVMSAVGLADVENARPMTPDTPMLAASIGKTFVAATVLALESEGLLSRSDLVSVHLGDRPWFDMLPNAGTMTIGQLLHHTAGIPDHVHLPAFQEAWAVLALSEDRFDPVDLVRLISGLEPLFEPGTAWGYSDTGYVLLGQVIEAVTGAPWQETVHARFLGPLGLSETFPSDRPDLPGIAVGYVAPDNPFGMPARTADAEGRLLWNPAVESAGGGFASTSRDLARWGHLLFSGEAMAEPYLDRLLDGVPVDPDAPGISYGAGVGIHAETPRGAVWGHGGWIPAYVSSLRHYADHGVTVAFQVNSDIGVMDDTSDLVPALEAALADLAIGSVRPADRP